ncbi:MAG: hypothetical protein EZS28_023684, partial [Streblomastix strix]
MVMVVSEQLVIDIVKLMGLLELIEWNLSPFFFSKTLAIAIRAIRSKWKIKIQHYMDDIILIHHSKDTLKQTTQEVIRFLQNLGWRLSPN